MFYKIIALLLCICAFQYVNGERKRLICKTVELNFTSKDLQTPNGLNKNDIFGQKDEKYVLLNASIDSAADQLILKMQAMEERIFKKLHASFLESQKDVFQDLQNAIIYQGTYYWVVIFPDGQAYPIASLTCQASGGKAADIVGDTLYRILREHIRATRHPVHAVTNVWTGMTWDLVDRLIKYSDGRLAPNYGWYPGHPYQHYSSMVLSVHKNSSVAKQGLFNSKSTTYHTGIVCQR